MLMLLLLVLLQTQETVTIKSSDVFKLQPTTDSGPVWLFPQTVPQYQRVIAVGQGRDDREVCVEEEGGTLRCLTVGDIRRLGTVRAK